MAIVAIDATLAGDSSVTAGATANYAAATSMAGEASTTLAATMLYAAASSMVADSTFTADEDLLDQETATFAGDSDFLAAATVGLALGMTPVGGSSFVIDPAGVKIINVLRPAPATAAPVTVPVIRVVPPAPYAPSYSVGSPITTRNRRREDDSEPR